MQMNHREFLRTAGAGVCLAGITSLCAAASSRGKPNIVLCMADDQGWRDMA